MKTRSYHEKDIPFVSDLGQYARAWTEWWTFCQPSWRQDGGWPLPKDDQTSTNWCKVGNHGRNGLFLVVMSTTWWASSVQSTKDWTEFDEAVEDVQWVIDQVITSVEALPSAVPPTRSVTPQELVPAQRLIG